jgi:hypothetical protein
MHSGKIPHKIEKVTDGRSTLRVETCDRSLPPLENHGMTRKEYLRNTDLPPTPFTAWDYVLSAVAFSLIAVAAVPQIASMIVHP